VQVKIYTAIILCSVHYDTYTVCLKFRSVFRPYCWKTASWSILVQWGQCIYRDADKSLARPRRKQATFPAFYRTWRFITTLTIVHHLPLPQPNQSIPLLITLLTGAACFLPGRAKDLPASQQYGHALAGIGTGYLQNGLLEHCN